MKLGRRLIWAGVSLLAFGSAVALAQSAPPETEAAPVDAPAAPPAVISPYAGSSGPEATSEAAPAPQASQPVEDAPVDMPANARSDWAPDTNSDALTETNASSGSGAYSTPRERPKARKVLSDAGDNAIGSGSYGQPDSQTEIALLTRSQRRERPVDPAKRADLLKLSRVMGSLHALRVSCSGRDDQTYRSRMATMLDLEAPQNGILRDPLVDAFNGGFQAHGRGASVCPADARGQEANLAKEGMLVARALGERYRPAPKAKAAALPPATQPRKNIATTPAPAPTPQAAPGSRASWTNAPGN